MGSIDELLKIVEEGKKKKIEELSALLEDEFKDKMEKLQKWYEEEKEKILKKFEEEKIHLEKMRNSTIDSILSKERAFLKSEIVKILKNKIIEHMQNAGEGFREKYLKKLFEEAEAEFEGSFVVVCRKEDIDIVKRFYSGKIITTDDLEGGLILQSEDGRFKVIATLEMLVERVEPLISEIAERKAGELR